LKPQSIMITALRNLERVIAHAIDETVFLRQAA
jgi:hypothetical protein